MLASIFKTFKSHPAFSDPRRVWLGIVLMILALKLLAVLVYVSPTRSIFDLGFFFDPYLKSLYAGNGFESCDLPVCDHSSRMPALPYFLYALSPFTLSLRAAAVVKVCLLSALVYFTCRDFALRITARTPLQFAFYAGATLFLIFAPTLVKHMATMHYEEGYLIEIQAVTVVTTLMLLSRVGKDLRWRDCAIPVLVASLGYLFKSSQILVWAVVAVVVVSVALASSRRGMAAAMVALALVAPLSWLTHNIVTGQKFSIMSSYDGENMFRGWNAHTLDVFPACHLDTLFVTLRTCEGRSLDLPHETGRADYPNEWAWNDGYKARATDWIVHNPEAAARTLGEKAAVFLAWPRLVPYVLMDETSEHGRKPAEEAMSALWISIGRLMEFAAFGMSFWLLAKGDGRARALALTCLALMAAYATPYILGYTTERHFCIFILMGVLCDFFLFAEIGRLRETRAAPSERP